MIRVTEVLDYLTEPELLNWYLNKGKTACKKISDESLRIGTIVDQLIREDIKLGQYAIPNNDESVKNCMKAWEQFKSERPGFIESVESIQDELTDGEIVGHPDIVTHDTIWDVKTSRTIYPKHWTQTVKYAVMRGKKRVGVIRLPKEDGVLFVQEFDDSRILDNGMNFFEYETKVFDSYLFCMKHNMTIREIVRRQLELEVLNVA